MPRANLLAISAVADNSRPIGQQIIDAIRMEISTRQLLPGAQLPSVRGLAEQLEVNPNTVAKAYAQLKQEGWLTTRPGQGLYVAERRPPLARREQERRFRAALQAFVADVVTLQYSRSYVVAAVEDELNYLDRRRQT